MLTKIHVDINTDTHAKYTHIHRVVRANPLCIKDIAHSQRI